MENMIMDNGYDNGYDNLTRYDKLDGVQASKSWLYSKGKTKIHIFGHFHHTKHRTKKY